MVQSLKERLQARQQALTDRRIEHFQSRFQAEYGDAHLDLACHAAFPLALTPDLLYTIWVNFDRDMQGGPLNIPWIAVADLLLSDLCREVGFELYEMLPAVRAALLQRLEEDPRFQPVTPGEPSRTEQLALFLQDYANNLLQRARPEDVGLRQLARSQRWAALAYLDPAAAAARLVEAFQAALVPDDRAELLHLAELTNSFAARLDAFAPLLPYARSMAAYARGENRAAASTIAALSSREVAGQTLAVPPELEEAVDDARSLSVATETDLERLPPETAFTVVWDVENTGTTSWNASYTLLQVGGEPLERMLAVVPPTPPGEQVRLSLELQAPAAPGPYSAEWRLHNELRQPFGATLTVQFTVFLPLPSLLAREYNLDELSKLAYELDVDPDNIGGATLEERSRELVGYLTRRERLGELLAALARSRPALDLSLYAPAEAVAQTASAPPAWGELMASAFNLEELALLSFDLGVDVDELEGETVAEKADALRARMQRHGRLGELLWQVSGQRPTLDLTPYGQPRPPGEAPAAVDPNQLYRLLEQSFNLEELKDLCFVLDVDFDNIPGSSRRVKARELVTYMRRRQRYEDLLLAMAEQRPHLDLDPYFRAVAGEEARAQSTTDLHQLLVESFNLEELAILAFDVGLDGDELPGTTLTEKASALLEQLRREGRLDALVDLIALTRPELDLSPFSSKTPDAARQAEEPLYRLLDRTYSLDEVRTLCFDLQVEYENLEGETKIRKLMELQKSMQQAHRLPELLALVASERPHLDLSPYGYAPESEPEAAQPEPTFAEPFDFTDLIARQADARVDHYNALVAAGNWLQGTGPQVLLFSGEPGSGKLAIAATLVRISREEIPPPEGLAALRPGFLSAIHFCDPQQPDTLLTTRIVEALAAQLGNRYPAFARRLRERVAGASGSSSFPNIPPPIEQSLAGAPGYVPPGAGPLRLDLAGIPAEDALYTYFLEPLQALFAGGDGEQVVILIAGLENALGQAPDANIAAQLSAISGRLPERARFIFTTRLTADLDPLLRSADVRRFALEPPAEEPLPPEIYRELHLTLLRCGPFDDDEDVRALFVDSRLSPWRSALPEASTAAGRVDATIAYLVDRQSDAGENALALLLEVLAEQQSGSECERDLLALADALKLSETL